MEENTSGPKERSDGWSRGPRKCSDDLTGGLGARGSVPLRAGSRTDPGTGFVRRDVGQRTRVSW